MQPRTPTKDGNLNHASSKAGLNGQELNRNGHAEGIGQASAQKGNQGQYD